MANKKSSFRMGNEFNGYGNVTYLKGTQRKNNVQPLQGNVRLTRDFSRVAPMALGGIPLFINPQSEHANLAAAIGGIAMANRVAVTKNAETGESSFHIHVAPGYGFTNGSYLQTTNKQVEPMDGLGMLESGWVPIQDGKEWKYRDEFGKYVVRGWINYKNDKYYLDVDGMMVTEWKKIGTRWYYFKTSIDESGRENGGQMVRGWREIHGLWYYFHPDSGYMITGFKKIDGKKYYLKPQEDAVDENDYGYMLTGWREIGEKWYYFHEQGDMAVSEWIDGENGDRYWVDENGVWTPQNGIIIERLNQLFEDIDTFMEEMDSDFSRIYQAIDDAIQINGAVAIGIAGSAGAGGYISGAAQLIVDLHGNIGLQFAVGTGIEAGASADATVYAAVYPGMEDIFGVEEFGVEMGGSIGQAIVGSASLLLSGEGNDMKPAGVLVGLGIGGVATFLEGHVAMGYTFPTVKLGNVYTNNWGNVYDNWKVIYQAWNRMYAQ